MLTLGRTSRRMRATSRVRNADPDCFVADPIDLTLPPTDAVNTLNGLQGA